MGEFLILHMKQKEENPDIVLSKAKESFVVREEQAQKR